MQLSQAALVALACILACTVLCSAHCVDENGNFVDWWISVKGAYISASPNANAQRGMSYIYLDAKNKAFSLSSKPLDNGATALGRTLQQLYNNGPANSGYVLYNDHTPSDDTSSSYAHAKGVVWFNSTGGFWLVHSTPRFPIAKAQTSTYTYPEYAKLYGQTFLCISMTLSNIDQVGVQLSYMNPQIYEKNIPAAIAARLPNLAAVLDGTNIKKGSAATSVLPVSSLLGQSFISFAKNKPWNKDLYTDLVIPYIADGMFIETWMRPYQPSCCPGADGCGLGSINVKSVRLAYPSSDIDYTETKDHAKWGISMKQQKGYTCIGDINRNLSQAKRGGGTVCIRDPAVWTSFKNIILELDSSC